MAYTDLSGAYFVYRTLVSWQWFDALAENDAYDRIPVGSVKTFNQAAAPTGWTQVTTQTDKCLRVVSGAGGGSGGAINFSSGFTLAHTHTMNNHTHTTANHQHNMDYDADSFSGEEKIITGSTRDPINFNSLGGGTSNQVYSQTDTDGGGDNSGGATPSSDSQLSNVTLKYVDLILASKD